MSAELKDDYINFEILSLVDLSSCIDEDIEEEIEEFEDDFIHCHRCYGRGCNYCLML